MPCSSCPDFHQKSFRIKHDDDKFFSRLLSKETSSKASNDPSFRVYYGDVSSAVPFTWETRPGTPKHHKSSENSYINPPPLTPPPSYYTTNLSNSTNKNDSSRSKFLFHNLLRRINLPKTSSTHFSSSSHSSSSSLSSPSWSSSSRSSFSDPMKTPTHKRRRRRFSSCGSSFDDQRSMDNDVCPSKLCYSAFMKKALLSVVGRGSAA